MDGAPVAKAKLECVLNCKDSKSFFRFPRSEEGKKTWMDRICLSVPPRNIKMARVCNNHFSERMFSYEGGKRLTACAIPDINIPGQLINTTPDGNLQIVKPRPVHNYMDLEQIPRIVAKSEIITSRSSRCFLKCKDAKSTFGFPQDKPSMDIWVKQLGLKEMPRRSTTARICKNHFSPRMFSNIKGQRLTSCAIPDINLPGEIVFRSEDDTPEVLKNSVEVTTPKTVDGVDVSTETNINTLQVPDTVDSLPQCEQEMNNLIRSVIEPSLIIEEVPQISRPEVLIDPIESIKSVINSTANKEGIVHVFQPGIERKAEYNGGVSKVALPEDVFDAESECVLKCPHGERLFRFPNNETNRQIWLKKIGLTHCFFNTRICNRHFSDRMYVKSKTRLAKCAYPDINIPGEAQSRIKDASRVLNDYRLILQDKHVCDVMELPEYICVLTVLKGHTEVDAVVNGIKYVQHKVDENIPKREREVQVDVSELIPTANVAIPADDYVEDVDIVENSDYQQLDWMNMFKSHVFASKVEMYECLVCGEISVGYACNLKHSTAHKESSLLCFQCGRMFSNQHKLKMHEKDKHLNQLRKALRCPKFNCKKAFHSKKLLHNHVDEHTKHSEHKCGKCSRVFSSSLKLHCHQVACRNRSRLKYPKRTRTGNRVKVKRTLC